MEGIKLKKLLQIQQELKAPKGQFNSFGKYKYRSCEDIVEAVKPLAHALDCVLMLSDELVSVGERFYIKATALLLDTSTGEDISVTALARESLTKKGMDESQITGTASSYARKYALNGLFAIDDTKDSDTDESKKNEKRDDKPQLATKEQVKIIMDKVGDNTELGGKILVWAKVEVYGDMTQAQASATIKRLNE